MNITRFTAINHHPKTLININGKTFECEIKLESNIHAIQFHDTKGHIEFHDKPNQDISSIEEIPNLQNLIQAWQTTHDNETDRPEIYYNKSNFNETRKFKIAENPDLTQYTTAKPLENEPFQIFNEETQTFIIDQTKKDEAEKEKSKIAILNQLELDLQNGFELFGHFWQSRDQDVSKLTGEIVSWQAGATPTPAWRTRDNINLPLTQEEILQLAKAMKEFYQTKFFESRMAIDSL